MSLLVLILLGAVVVLLYRAGRRRGRDDIVDAVTYPERMAGAVVAATDLLTDRALARVLGTAPTIQQIANLPNPGLWYAARAVSGATPAEDGLYNKVFSNLVNRRTVARRQIGAPETEEGMRAILAQELAMSALRETYGPECFELPKLARLGASEIDYVVEHSVLGDGMDREAARIMRVLMAIALRETRQWAQELA
jgi:hypothetical protein